MNKNVKVRSATPEDAFAISFISKIAWCYAYKGIMSDDFLFSKTSVSAMKISTDKLADDMRNTTDGKIFLVAENENSEVIGFAFGGDIRNEGLETDKDLHTIYVHPAAHGYGAGKALMLEFARRMQLQGAKTFGAGCMTANKSMEFYKHMGGKFLFETRNPRFESLSETFFEYNIEKLLSV